MEFWTTLIKVSKADDSVAPNAYKGMTAKESLKANCTHVKDDYWIMEGDTDALKDDGIVFKEVAEGAVGSLGGLTEKELVEVCKNSYGVTV